MNKSQLFKAAHKLVQEIIQFGDNYSATFSACLKLIYERLKITSQSFLEKLILAGGKVWQKGNYKRIYLNMTLVKDLDLGINFNEKKHKLFFDLETQKFDGSSSTFVKALNSKI